MKAHKRAKKISAEMNCFQALKLIASNTFGEVEKPSIDLMHRMLRKEPLAIMRMPQASNDLKIAAIRLDISLLMHEFAWGFDTEHVFPGSKVWQEHYSPLFLSACHWGQELTNGIRWRMMGLWKPFEPLSTWPESNLYEHERHFLRENTFEENLALAADLLAKNPGGKRSAVESYDDVSDSLIACLESAMNE